MIHGGKILRSTENRYVDRPINRYDIIEAGNFYPYALLKQVQKRGIFADAPFGVKFLKLFTILPRLLLLY